MQIQYKYVRISEYSGGELCARWEVGDNRRYDMKYSCVVNEAERGFGDLQLLPSNSNGDGSMDSMVLYSGIQELRPDLVGLVNLSR